MALSLPHSSQPKRSKTILSPEGTTAKFLYTIIKQLDLKTIDWNEVALQLDISNGHAARMRYSRFKTQIEALLKDSKSKMKSPSKETKVKARAKGKRTYDDMTFETTSSDQLFMEDDAENYKKVKSEACMTRNHPWPNIVKAEKDRTMPNTTILDIKTEQGLDQMRLHHSTISDIRARNLTKDTVDNVHIIDNLCPEQQNTTNETCRIVAQGSSTQAEVVTPSAGPDMVYSRPRYQQYHPHANGIRMGMQRPFLPRPVYQGMNSYHAYPARNPYQQPLYSSVYAPSAYELATQASYPWPYSENSVSRYAMPNSVFAQEMTANGGIPDMDNIDFGKFATEYGNISSEAVDQSASTWKDPTRLTASPNHQTTQSTNGVPHDNTTCDPAQQACDSVQEQAMPITIDILSQEDTSQEIEEITEAEAKEQHANSTTSNEKTTIKVEPDTSTL